MSHHHHHHESLLQEVLVRASTDLPFRKQLLTHPDDAIYEALGVRLPDELRIKFIERPASVDMLIVLPDVHAPGEELDDDDLDAVAGGTSTTGCTW